jgi:MFS superfamily sulfate permease-like transporter/CRP-like cAMP-binding protein
MSHVPVAVPPAPAVLSTLKRLQREVVVGLPVALTLLAASLAAGVLIVGPLGPDYVAFGAAAALSGAIFGGACASLIATSSVVLWSPLVTIALVQASLAATLMANPVFARNPAIVVTALVICAALAGLLQIAFGLAGLAKIVKYTPHPVLAGFVNGVCASILLSQLKLFLPFHRWQITKHVFVLRPAMFALVLGLVAFNFWVESRTRRLPAPLICLIAGVAGYYILRFIEPGLDFGPTLGTLPLGFPPAAPIGNIVLPDTQRLLLVAAPDIILVALAIVVVGTFQSLLAFRMVENMSNEPISARRGLVALGSGDIVSAATGGLVLSVATPMTATAFRNGGRTRLVGLTGSIGLLLLVVLLPNALGAIPLAAIVALLFIVSISGFDRWSARLLWDVLRGNTADERPRIYYDLGVVLIVMGVTVSVSIVPGILAGFAAACITFVINMSQPIVRKRLSGANVRSKRVRTAAEAALLRESGERSLVLQLSGVLFFGNSETLSREVVDKFEKADVIVLDCRGVADIDVSGANIIRELVEKSRRLGKRLLFCNVPVAHRKTIERIAGDDQNPTIFSDLDSALESIEDRALQKHEEAGAKSDPLRLEEHDFVHGLDDAERDVLASLLTRREFRQGATLAVEDEPGDRMWLIMKGCVNIRLRVDDARGSRRIASLATGTTVGEMALVENATRSASIVAAEDVVCLELDRNSYEMIMRDNPQIGTKLLTNLIREMAHRVRNTSEQLRETES